MADAFWVNLMVGWWEFKKNKERNVFLMVIYNENIDISQPVIMFLFGFVVCRLALCDSSNRIT